MKLKILNAVFALVALGALCLYPPSAFAQQTFQQWLDAFYPVAAEKGINQSTYEMAFEGITEPDPVVLKKAAYQPEFTQEIWDYLDARVNPLSITRGKKAEKENAATLEAVSHAFAVPPSVLLAIWSMESNYGAILERTDRLHYVPQALATLGYGDPKRQKFARGQLVAALTILQAGDVSKDQMTGSWAGAMGHTQFIPTSYLAYGVDMDGNGRRDIWNSVADALATAANLLKKNGWQEGKTWGYEVVLPAKSVQLEGETKTLLQWQQLGFKRPGEKPFPRLGDKAELKVLAGPKGPGFLMLKNFFVIKRYNNSDFYALAVGLLADTLAGWQGLVQPWPRPVGALSAKEKFMLQDLLKAKGFYQGEVDGQLGSGTRKSIRAYEEASKLEITGLPTLELLHHLQQ